MGRISVTGSAKIALPGEGLSKATKLLEILEIRKHELSHDMDGEVLLAIDHNENDYRKFIKKGGMPRNTILVRLEPPTVFPLEYKEKTERKYFRIVTPGAVTNGKATDLGWPYKILANPNDPESFSSKIEDQISSTSNPLVGWSTRPINLSLIASNKVSSKNIGNYALRRKIGSTLSAEELYLFGPLWDSLFREKVIHRVAVAYFALKQKESISLTSLYGNLFFNYPAARGPISDKHDVLKKSKFALVIENSNTYVSEKLFDAILNGAVPIYVGPSLESLGFPMNIAIESTGDSEEIRKIIFETSIKKAYSTLISGRNFLSSHLFQESWTEESVYEKIADVVEELVKAKY